MAYFKGNIIYINVMKNMSVDCDCCAVAEIGYGSREYELIEV